METRNKVEIQSDAEHKGNIYRFIPESNYWVCIKSESIYYRWVICSDEFGMELTRIAKSEGHDIDQMLIDNKCKRSRMRLSKKKSVPTTTTFMPLFESESIAEAIEVAITQDKQNFISLFPTE